MRATVSCWAVMAVIFAGLGIATVDATAAESQDADGVVRLHLLPPGPDNPRNSEGDFVQLADGRLMLVYTHFFGGTGDHAPAKLCARFSSDGGRTWTAEDDEVVANEGEFNIMSVSLLRLRDGRIALFYLRKNSLADCRPVVRFSSDEAQTWTEPRECITDRIAYHVVNNDRVVQLSTGRLLIPAALHQGPDGNFHSRGRTVCYYSDDAGATWRRSASELQLADYPDDRSGLQEPGVVELADGSVLMFCRTNVGSQYLSRSNDGGETWSTPAASDIASPISPATIERIPSTGDLLLVWNDHRGRDDLGRNRTPLCAALSRDDGRTWGPSKVLEDDADGWYCYTAMQFVGDRVVLAHCAGGPGFGHLNRTQVTSFPVAWLYE